MGSRYEKYTTHHTSRRTDGWDYTQPAAYFVTMCTENRARLFGAVRRGRMILNVLGRIVAAEWQQSEEIRDRVHLDAFVVMPNHLHGIVVFADSDVEAPTCPRGYRVFGATGRAEGPSDDSNSETASHGGSDGPPGESNSTNPSVGGATEPTGPSNSEKASTGGSTLGGESGNRGEMNGDDEPDDDRPTGPAPQSLGSFVAGFKSAATKRINQRRGTPGAAVWQRNYHDRIIRTERHWRAARRYVRRNPAEWSGDRLNQHDAPDS
jgi:REP element-mobilizing transposase RayT